jgi:hypothetical protein
MEINKWIFLQHNNVIYFIYKISQLPKKIEAIHSQIIENFYGISWHAVVFMNIDTTHPGIFKPSFQHEIIDFIWSVVKKYLHIFVT